MATKKTPSFQDRGSSKANEKQGIAEVGYTKDNIYKELYKYGWANRSKTLRSSN